MIRTISTHTDNAMKSQEKKKKKKPHTRIEEIKSHTRCRQNVALDYHRPNSSMSSELELARTSYGPSLNTHYIARLKSWSCLSLRSRHEWGTQIASFKTKRCANVNTKTNQQNNLISSYWPYEVKDGPFRVDSCLILCSLTDLILTVSEHKTCFVVGYNFNLPVLVVTKTIKRCAHVSTNDWANFKDFKRFGVFFVVGTRKCCANDWTCFIFLGFRGNFRVFHR